MAEAKAITEDAVSVVGVADATRQKQTALEPEIKIGVWEDIDDMKRRLRTFLSKMLLIGFHTRGTEVVEGAMKKTGMVDEKWVHYTDVQVMNGVYMDAFRKVPKTERVVFIPHCMRDAKNCIAPIDEDGYHCRKCGRCAIRKITEECDKRGIKWYMCGGGSQVINIIQRTKPKAIIGIACYNEIQMAIEKLKGGSIPIHAVMLKKHGCLNTEVDLNEVIEALDI